MLQIALAVGTAAILGTMILALVRAKPRPRAIVPPAHPRRRRLEEIEVDSDWSWPT